MSEAAIISERESAIGAEEISDELARDIIHDVYPIGSKLPTERSLARKFGVTRHVVREALKRLESVGLVRIRQGSGIFAEPVSVKATIEMMHVLVRNRDGTVNVKIMKDVMEYRHLMATTIACLAAERRTEEQLAELKDIVRKRRQSLGDSEQLQAVDLDLMKLLGEATQNLIYDLIYESIAKVSLQMGIDFDVTLSDHIRIQENVEEMVEAIAAKDRAQAEKIVEQQLVIFMEIAGRGLVVS